MLRGWDFSTFTVIRTVPQCLNFTQSTIFIIFSWVVRQALTLRNLIGQSLLSTFGCLKNFLRNLGYRSIWSFWIYFQAVIDENSRSKPNKSHWWRFTYLSQKQLRPGVCKFWKTITGIFYPYATFVLTHLNSFWVKMSDFFVRRKNYYRIFPLADAFISFRLRTPYRSNLVTQLSP